MTTLSAAYPSSLPAPTDAPLPVRAKSPFIVSPWFDGFFFFASVAVVFLAWAASSMFRVDGYTIVTVVAIVANGPHLVSTWTRVYMDKREWRTRPVHIFVVPALIIASVVCVNLFVKPSGARLLNSILIYWAAWHFVAQNWGLLRLYQKRSGEPDSSWAVKLERPMLFTFVAWCLLHRLVTGPRRLFGTEIYYVDLPLPVVNSLLGASALMAGAWVVLKLREGRGAWTQSTLIRAAFLGCAALGFYVPFILITGDDMAGFAAAACWHGIQYLGIVRFYHRNAWKDGVHADARLISYVSQPGWGRTFMYVALLMLLAGSGVALVKGLAWATGGTPRSEYLWGSIVWTSLTFSHYYLDGVIWKLSRDKKVAERLAVA